jgi:hypothetical protein
MALWRFDGERPVPIKATPMDLEGNLERMILAEPDLLGPERLLLLGTGRSYQHLCPRLGPELRHAAVQHQPRC